MANKQTASVDFDGVLNTYTKWDGEDNLFEPRPGVEEFLKALSEKYRVVIFSARRPMAIELWLREHKLHQYVSEVTNRKPLAVAYIDDRAIGFNGCYQETLEQLENFQPWYKRGKADPGQSQTT